MHQTTSSSTAWLWRWKSSKIISLVPPKAENDNSSCNTSPLKKHSQRLSCKPKTTSSVPTGNGSISWTQTLRSSPALPLSLAAVMYNTKSQSQNQDFSFLIGLWPQPNATSITPNGAMTSAAHVKGEFISLEEVQDWTKALTFPGFTTGKSSSTLGWNDEKKDI